MWCGWRCRDRPEVLFGPEFNARRQKKRGRTRWVNLLRCLLVELDGSGESVLRLRYDGIWTIFVCNPSSVVSFYRLLGRNEIEFAFRD
jgi:hypothetical protein